MEWTSDISSLLLIIIGIFLGLKAKQRRFNRTNKFGIERFANFWAKVWATSTEHVLVGGSVLLISSGTLLLASEHLDNWGWILMAPVMLFMLYLMLGM